MVSTKTLLLKHYYRRQGNGPFWSILVLQMLKSRRARFGSVRLRFGGGTVRAVPVFGCGGSSTKRFISVFQYSLTGKDGSGFGSWKRFWRFRLPYDFRINYLQNYASESESKIRVKYLSKHECERSSLPISINANAKATKYLRGINFALICVATVIGPKWTILVRFNAKIQFGIR